MLELNQYLTGTVFLVIVWGGSALLAARGFAQLFTRMREQHPDLWRSLGEPTAFNRVEPTHSAAIRKMVQAGADYPTDDEALRARLVWLSRVLLVSRITSLVWVIWTLALLVEWNPGR